MKLGDNTDQATHGQSEKVLHWFQHEPEEVHLLCLVSVEMVSKCFPPDCVTALVKREVGVMNVIK